jgi:hypothetical protein
MKLLKLSKNKTLIFILLYFIASLLTFFIFLNLDNKKKTIVLNYRFHNSHAQEQKKLINDLYNLHCLKAKTEFNCFLRNVQQDTNRIINTDFLLNFTNMNSFDDYVKSFFYKENYQHIFSGNENKIKDIFKNHSLFFTRKHTYPYEVQIFLRNEISFDEMNNFMKGYIEYTNNISKKIIFDYFNQKFEEYKKLTELNYQTNSALYDFLIDNKFIENADPDWVVQKNSDFKKRIKLLEILPNFLEKTFYPITYDTWETYNHDELNYKFLMFIWFIFSTLLILFILALYNKKLKDFL